MAVTEKGGSKGENILVKGKRARRNAIKAPRKSVKVYTNPSFEDQSCNKIFRMVTGSHSSNLSDQAWLYDMTNQLRISGLREYRILTEPTQWNFLLLALMRSSIEAEPRVDDVLLQRAVKLAYILCEALFAALLRVVGSVISYHLSPTQTLKERFSLAYRKWIRTTFQNI